MSVAAHLYFYRRPHQASTDYPVVLKVELLTVRPPNWWNVRKEGLAVFCNFLSYHKMALSLTQWAFKDKLNNQPHGSNPGGFRGFLFLDSTLTSQLV